MKLILAAFLVLAFPVHALTCGNWKEMKEALLEDNARLIFTAQNKNHQTISIWHDQYQWAAFVISDGNACIVEWGPMSEI